MSLDLLDVLDRSDAPPGWTADDLLARLAAPTLPAWAEHAACRGMPVEQFFPGAGGGDDVAKVSAARKVCSGCPVLEDCLAWAVAHVERGFWGGTTERERQAIRASA